MTTETRQGLGLLAIAGVCLLLALVLNIDNGGQVAMMGAFLFGVGGLLLAAKGLLHPKADESAPPSHRGKAGRIE